ncbi:hypothetical protein BDV25DRAFT_171321 [Aspergillus avenaceus]|uniref:t-SNARE coiled-coil homology domain-containing protein n=1 Tax=Aspergillus avenaceus TaxID=36643 RepID=A0A5N6TE95_ASPAV|nr:hypothetical protein BDV25DRAFT_171321 [Aspergillus avenaceus]
MSLKQEIETWVLALEHYDHQEYDEALRVFGLIADTSKICFNCGVIYATLGEHEKAVECYQRAVSLDQYLAIAYFQEGVSNFLLGDFEEALANFNDTLLYLRGNTSIDYEQLGLRFRLFSCEVLFNRGLCYIYLQQMGPGMQDLEYAAKERVTPDHGVINDAIRERAEGYTVFSIPVGVIYRPNQAKVKNLKTKDYLGKARLIAAAASDQSHTPTQAAEINRTQSVLDHRAPPESLYAASKLVQRNITRSRQHSEPPLNRHLFPPTPPPDDKGSASSSSGSLGRPGSLRAARPPRLDLDRPGAQVSGRVAETTPEKPRVGTTRTASEPRGPPRLQHRASQGEFTVYRETGHRRNASDTGLAPAPRMYGDEVYSGYSRPAVVTHGGRRGMPRQRERYIDEQDEYASEAGEEGGADGDFEIVESRRRTRSPNRGSRRANSRRPEVRRFRVKVHAVDDTRYIIIGPTIDFREFEGKIRDKFGFRCMLKIRMQDDGDMITLVDQEDLDMLVSSARETAIREGSELGKMETDKMTDLTPTLNNLLPKTIPKITQSKAPLPTDEFLKEAIRIPTNNPNLKDTTTNPKSKEKKDQEKELTDQEREEIEKSTSLLLRDLSNSISTLANAESLRRETRSRVLRGRYARSGIWMWASGSSSSSSSFTTSFGDSGDGYGFGSDGSDGSDGGKTTEQIEDESKEREVSVVREGVIWFLRRGLEHTLAFQGGMVEKRIERVRERERSVLFLSSSSSFSSQPFSKDSSFSKNSGVNVSGSSGVGGNGIGGGWEREVLGEDEKTAIENQLSPEQLQLFEEENDGLIRYFEDALGKVQNAEKSLLEISSLQQTLVSHLSTQEEHINQMVSDAALTQTNVGRGNKELKKATERKSTAQAVFWGTLGLCTSLIVWDLIF